MSKCVIAGCKEKPSLEIAREYFFREPIICQKHWEESRKRFHEFNINFLKFAKEKMPTLNIDKMLEKQNRVLCGETQT